MNKVILMGRVTRDPEIRYSQSANPLAVARYGLAVRRQYAKQGDQDVDFFNIVAFGKAAEFAEKYFKKGQLVSIVGRVQVNTWEDEQKMKHLSVDIITEEQHFAESRPLREEKTDPNQASSVSTSITEEYTYNIGDDDLPF
jgi:single-strand DNA-binding protein